MRAHNIIIGLMLGAGLIAGGLYLLQADFANGDVYPDYSSLRSDSSGSKLLYDTLARVPGVAVSRNLLPLDYLAGSDSVVFLLNVSPYALNAGFLKSADTLAARGNRVVTAMRELEQFDDIGNPEVIGPLDKTWHVRLGFDPKASSTDRKLYIHDAAGWSVLGQSDGRSGAKLLAIERTVGKGSEVLFSDSGSFGNQSVADNAGFQRLSSAIGPYSKIVFDEQHLGIEQSGSVVGLARSFHLTGMALGFAICAALFIWRNAAAFPPPEAARETSEISGRGSRSGLLTLLRRHVAKSDLARVSWNEWLSTGRRGTTPENITRAEEALQSSADPVITLSRIQSIVQPKGNH